MQFVSRLLYVRLSSLTGQAGKPDVRVRLHPLTAFVSHHGLVWVIEILLMASCLAVAAESASQPKAPVPDATAQQNRQEGGG